MLDDLAYAAAIRQPSIVPAPDEKDAHNVNVSGAPPGYTSSEDGEPSLPEPTTEELQTLRRISGKIPWQAMSITFVEFAERFSWYGTTALFVNFIQQPRPFGSRTGAIVESDLCYNAPGWDYDSCTQPGGLGRGQQASTGLSTFNQFWAYLMPLFGGYIADTYLGRYMTIQCSIGFAILGHILLIISSLPTVMDSPDTALGVFALALVILGLGTGGFKSNISPLLAEQITETRPHVLTDKKGERVIRDPAVTVSRVFLYFYLMINVGSLIGGIGMVYAERYIGFWLAYALPTFVFFLAPAVLIGCKKNYVLRPPTGSVLGRAFKLLSLLAAASGPSTPCAPTKTTIRAASGTPSSPAIWAPPPPSGCAISTMPGSSKSRAGSTRARSSSGCRCIGCPTTKSRIT